MSKLGQEDDPLYDDDVDGDPPPKTGGLVGSFLAWASRNPIMFGVYALIFIHFGYRIVSLLLTPLE